MKKSYTRSQKILHLIISLAFIGQMVGVNFARYGTTDKSAIGMIFLYHKSFGLVLLFVSIAFYIKYFGHKVPLKEGLARWEKTLATVVHRLLLAAILLMPLSGVLMAWFAGKPLPFFGVYSFVSPVEKIKVLSSFFHQLHHFAAYVLYVCVPLHLAGTYKHYRQRQYQHLDMINFKK